MQFEWDEAKNPENVSKHGIAFEDVAVIFDGPMLVDPDEREDYGEERWNGVGFLGEVAVVVVWTDRQPDVIHIISAR